MKTVRVIDTVDTLKGHKDESTRSRRASVMQGKIYTVARQHLMLCPTHEA